MPATIRPAPDGISGGHAREQNPMSGSDNGCALRYIAMLAGDRGHHYRGRCAADLITLLRILTDTMP